MLTIGTLGAADITPQALIYPCINEPAASVQTIAARDMTMARDFARFHRIPKVLPSYSDVISSDVDAIYNPLPISHHKEWSIAALQQGKHVLCEKSLACNEAEAIEMTEVAKKNDLILMDAFHYRYHPLFEKAREIYHSGRLGKIQSMFAIFSIPGTPDAADIRMIFETGGGVTMDIGCYPISWIRHLTDEEPEVESASAVEGPRYVDLMLEANFVLPSGIKAKAVGDMRPNGKFKAEIEVIGDAGSMVVKNPLAPHMGHLIETTIEEQKEFITVDRRTTYCYQLDAFLQAVTSGQQPITSGDDAIKQMHVIDQCYRAAGLPLRGS